MIIKCKGKGNYLISELLEGKPCLITEDSNSGFYGVNAYSQNKDQLYFIKIQLASSLLKYIQLASFLLGSMTFCLNPFRLKDIFV